MENLDGVKNVPSQDEIDELRKNLAVDPANKEDDKVIEKTLNQKSKDLFNYAEWIKDHVEGVDYLRVGDYIMTGTPEFISKLMPHLQAAIMMLHEHSIANGMTIEDFVNYYDKYLKVDGNVISATIQKGPIKEVGVNGLQVTDLLSYIMFVYKALDMSFPCDENKETLRCIAEARIWQAQRTRNREERGVEGFNKQ